MLKICLFGSPQILLNQHQVPINRRKSRALVYYLAAQDRPINREQLLVFFWPEEERKIAQQTLRTMIHGLRKILGHTLVVEENELSIRADVDVRAFREVLDTPAGKPINDQTRLAAALDLVRGDFLEGFSLPDSDEFNNWTVQFGEQLRRLAVRGLSVLSQEYADQNNFASAQDVLEKALQLDPLQEDLQRDMLRLLYQSGDRAGAIRRYDTFRKLLDEELGVPPMPETRALYDSILAEELPAAVPHARVEAKPTAPQRQFASSSFSDLTPKAEIPFIGRQKELNQIREGVTAGKLVLVEGEPGIGKTRLVEEYLHQSGFLVLNSAANELQQVLPYQPWREALRKLLTLPGWPKIKDQLQLADVWKNEVSRILPELERNQNTDFISAQADESRLWEGIHQFLSQVSRQVPLLVFLDDLHWADSATIGLLGYLVRMMKSSEFQVRFLATSHPYTSRSALGKLAASLTREDRIIQVVPDRLDSEEIIEISKGVSPAYYLVLANWLERNSEGNAYFLVELLHLARSQGILTPGGQINPTELSTSPVVPQNVYSLLEVRLARLSESARQILDAAVAAGKNFDVDVVFEASGLSEDEAIKGLGELEAGGIVRSNSEDGRKYTFLQSLLMEVAYREAGEARHRRFHRRIAEAIEKIYPDQRDNFAGLLASHFEEGNAPQKAAPYARRAGALAESLAAWFQSIGFYQQALRDETNPKFCIPTWIALGQVYSQVGEPVLSVESYQNALDLALELGDIELQNQSRIALGGTYLLQSRLSEAIDQAQQVLFSGVQADALDAEFLWGTALSLGGADLDGASQHLGSAAKMCEIQSLPVKRTRIEFEMGGVAAQKGDLRKAVELYRRSLETAHSINSSESLQWRVLAYNNLAYHLYLLDDPTAEEFAQKGLQLAQEKGINTVQPYLLSTLGEIKMSQNKLIEAGSLFDEGLSLSEKFGVAERVAGLTANLGRLAQKSGDLPKSIQLLKTALQQADELGTQHLAVQVRIWLAPLLPESEARGLLEQVQKLMPRGSKIYTDEINRIERSFLTQ